MQENNDGKPKVEEENPQTLFKQAIIDGDDQKVESLLLNPDVDLTDDKDGEYEAEPITLAIINGHPQIVKLLLSVQKVVDQIADKSVLKLINEGSDLDPVMITAIKYKQPNVLSVLLEDGRFDPMIQENYPLKYACELGYIECVELLLSDHRMDLAGEGYSVIQYACLSDNVEIVKRVLSHSAINTEKAKIFAVEFALDYSKFNVHRWLILHSNRKLQDEFFCRSFQKCQVLNPDEYSLVFKEVNISKTSIQNEILCLEQKSINIFTIFSDEKQMPKLQYMAYVNHNAHDDSLYPVETLNILKLSESRFPESDLKDVLDDDLKLKKLVISSCKTKVVEKYRETAKTLAKVLPGRYGFFFYAAQTNAHSLCQLLSGNKDIISYILDFLIELIRHAKVVEDKSESKKGSGKKIFPINLDLTKH